MENNVKLTGTVEVNGHKLQWDVSYECYLESKEKGIDIIGETIACLIKISMAEIKGVSIKTGYKDDYPETDPQVKLDYESGNYPASNFHIDPCTFEITRSK